MTRARVLALVASGLAVGLIAAGCSALRVNVVGEAMSPTLKNGWEEVILH